MAVGKLFGAAGRNGPGPAGTVLPPRELTGMGATAVTQPGRTAEAVFMGNNCRVARDGDQIRKVSRHAFAIGVARALACHLEEYAAAVAGQPVMVPVVRRVRLLPEPGGRARVEHITDRCPAPNLAGLDDAVLPAAVHEVLTRIAAMSTMDGVGALTVPIDASAQNFHVADGRVWLVDVFPPLPRRPDGTLALQFLQHSTSRIRAGLAGYAKGTVSGAIAHTLFTAVARGDRPLRQVAATVRGYPDWCYDVLPAGLPTRVRDHLRGQLDERFGRHLLRSVRSNAVCVMRGLAGLPAYAATPAEWL